MNWIFQPLLWYLVLFVIGVVTVPLTRRLLFLFSLDGGYAFAKTVGLVILTYTAFVLGTVKILPFSQIGLLGILFCFGLMNVYLLRKQTQKKKHSFLFLLFEEGLFFAAFFFWVYIRSQEPSIRGLEKFMDFGFINSILRSHAFPPLDMWYSADALKPNGYPINYYYFGHLSAAVLIKLSGIKSTVGYNLILATIFALSVTQVFSLITNIVSCYLGRVTEILADKLHVMKLIFIGLLGSFIVNLGGNLHTIYLFTKGYPNENPIPFWEIFASYNPSRYWYPNATRFIPFTIHEFPSYSWVVADLHGHVFDIPFVLTTIALLFTFFLHMHHLKKTERRNLLYPFAICVLLGFATAVLYMTNAFDGPIYILFTVLILFFLFRLTKPFIVSVATLIVSFIFFSLPFSLFFKPFVSGIGVNCAPGFLVRLQKLGPFLFEKGNCQVSPPWMLFVLWGFFWVSFVLFLITKRMHKIKEESIDLFMFSLFGFGTILILIPEFFYIKDIYPAHFRANTMFKLGYQAFILMGIASTYAFVRIKSLERTWSFLLSSVFVFFLFFVVIYPVFSIPSYYGTLDRPVETDGAKWLDATYPEDKEIIDYLNRFVKNQPVILEAQGDSYTDYERISSYTGLPTVAGWWVHEWLWRGSSDVVGNRIPDIGQIYESNDSVLTKRLLNKYHVQYVIVSQQERKKYPNLIEDKFQKVGRLIFRSSNGFGALYQVN